MNTINAHDLKARIENADDVLVIDVLPTEHYETSHIPGATNIPLGAERFVDAVEGVAADKAQPVVVYCGSSDCDMSPKAAERLEQAGFTNVVDFVGGIKEWKAAGFELTRN